MKEAVEVVLQVKVTRKSFLDRLKQVAPLISNGLLPVLSYVHLYAGEDKVTLLANDLERAVQVEVDGDACQVEHPGEQLIPFAPLMAIFTRWSSETITIKVVEGVAKDGKLLPPDGTERTAYLFDSESSDADIRCELPLEDYPLTQPFLLCA